MTGNTRASAPPRILCVLLMAMTMVLASLVGAGPTLATAACAIEPAAELTWSQARAGLGCAASPPGYGWTAEQFFERGVMLWREDTRMIYVLAAEGTWRQYEDHFYEGQPERAGYHPPLPWLREPIRGFGLVWRERLGGTRAAIGWATNDEQGLDSVIQVFEHGLAIHNATGRAFALLKDHTWRRP